MWEFRIVAPDTSEPQGLQQRFMRETGQAAAVARIAEPLIEELGFRLIGVVVNGQAGGTVQIRAERPDGSLTVGDCEKISRGLSPLLDAYDPVGHAYRLEVSSPGIDRPLVRPADFEAWAGFEAKIELRELVSGRKRFKGRIEGFVDGEVRLITELKPAKSGVKNEDNTGTENEGEALPAVIGFPVSMIDNAKLVLTDELVRESLSRRKNSAVEPGDVGDGSEMD